MLKTVCPNCQEELELEEEQRGKPTRCPHCQKAFRAPLYDNEDGLDDGPPTSPRIESLTIFAVVWSALGVLVTAIGLIMVATGAPLPVPPQAIAPGLILPIISLAIAWYVASRTRRTGLVWTARILAYCWSIGLVVLFMKLTPLHRAF